MSRISLNVIEPRDFAFPGRRRHIIGLATVVEPDVSATVRVGRLTITIATARPSERLDLSGSLVVARVDRAGECTAWVSLAD